MGNDGRYYRESSAPYVPKTRVELAREQRDIALQNLTSAASQLTKASNDFNEAKAAEHTACTCCPQHVGRETQPPGAHPIFT